MQTTYHYLTFATLLSIVCTTTALEIRKPTDLNYAVEIYERNGSGHNELACAAISFRDRVPEMPLHRATSLTLKAPLKNATIVTIDKDTDEIIQKFTFKEPLRDNSILELTDCRSNGDKKNVCTLNHEIVSPSIHKTKESLKELDKMLEDLENTNVTHTLAGSKNQRDFHEAKVK